MIESFDPDMSVVGSKVQKLGRGDGELVLTSNQALAPKQGLGALK